MRPPDLKSGGVRPTRNKDFGLDWDMAMFRSYDPTIGRWTQVDPLADIYYSWSPYNYVLGNPISFTDSDGRSVDGDIYNLNGVHIGNDGKDNNKVYVKLTRDDTQLSQSEAQTGVAKTGINLMCYSCDVINLASSEELTHEQFQQFAANVYNEAPYETSDEKDKIASAIVNRKETHSLGGSWEKTLDRIMFAKDSHEKKRTTERASPGKGDLIEGTQIKATNVRTRDYQSFYNASTSDRNSDSGMRDAVRATVSGLTGPDKVNGANMWVGKGQGRGSKFKKEKR